VGLKHVENAMEVEKDKNQSETLVLYTTGSVYHADPVFLIHEALDKYVRFDIVTPCHLMQSRWSG